MGIDRGIPVVVVLGLGCSFDASGAGGANTIGAHDTETGTGSGSGSSTGSTGIGTTASSTNATTNDEASGGTISSSGSAETTAEPPSSESGELPEGLVERDLVARWFLDESPGGIMPIRTADAAEEPFDLDIDFSSGHLQWTEENGQRGLRWSIPEGIGAPLRAIEGSKFDMLQGRTEATIEIVASVEGVTDKDSRLFHIGTGMDAGDFTLRADELQRVEFVVNGKEIAGWTVDLPTIGRAVFHVVFDTTQAEPTDRAQLYVNGGLIEPASSSPPNPDTPIELSAAPYLALGNRDGDRSIAGAVFYAAFYGSALDLPEIEHNATLLFEDDDGP